MNVGEIVSIGNRYHRHEEREEQGSDDDCNKEEVSSLDHDIKSHAPHYNYDSELAGAAKTDA